MIRWASRVVGSHRWPGIGRLLFMTYALELETIEEVLRAPDESPDGFTHKHWRAKLSATNILERFRIKAIPVEADTVHFWLHYMTRIIEASRRGDIRCARNLAHDRQLRFFQAFESRDHRPHAG